MKNKERNGLLIDSAALRGIIVSRGWNLSTFSESLGYNKSYLSHALSAGWLSMPAVKMLEAMYGIKYEDYAYKEKEKENNKQEAEVKEENMPAGLDYGVLYEVINKAVYEAVKKAWSE